MLETLKRLTCAVSLLVVVMLAGAPGAPARASEPERQRTTTAADVLANVQSLEWRLDGVEYRVFWIDGLDFEDSPLPALWLFEGGEFVHDLVLQERDGVLFFGGKFDGRGNATLNGHARLDWFSNAQFEGTALMLDFESPLSMRVAVDPEVGVIVGGEKCLCTTAAGGNQTDDCENKDCDRGDDCSPPNNPGAKFCNWRERPDVLNVDVYSPQLQFDTE